MMYLTIFVYVRRVLIFQQCSQLTRRVTALHRKVIDQTEHHSIHE